MLKNVEVSADRLRTRCLINTYELRKKIGIAFSPSYVFLLGLVFFISACSLDGSVKHMNPSSGGGLTGDLFDFAKSSIATFPNKPAGSLGSSNGLLSSGNYRAIADSQDVMWVRIRLMNSDNSVVKGLTPEMSVSGAPVQFVEYCDESDSDGVSWCALSASTPGERVLTVSNAQGLSKSISFDPKALAGQNIGVGGAGIYNKQLPSGYKVTLTVGQGAAPVSGESHYEVKNSLGQSVPGWKVFLEANTVRDSY